MSQYNMGGQAGDMMANNLYDPGDISAWMPQDKPKIKREKGETNKDFRTRKKTALEDWNRRYSMEPKYIRGRLDAAQNQAEQANEQRYQQSLQEVGGLRGAAERRIGERATNARATGMQGLVSSGLFNTTTQGSIARGVERDREAGLQDVDAMIADRRLGIIQGREDTPGGRFSDIYALQQQEAMPQGSLGQGARMSTKPLPGRFQNQNYDAEGKLTSAGVRKFKLPMAAVGKFHNIQRANSIGTATNVSGRIKSSLGY
jgi:hypothetical protein